MLKTENLPRLEYYLAKSRCLVKKADVFAGGQNPVVPEFEALFLTALEKANTFSWSRIAA